MKKNLFYLFALICSVSLFTACSDDDDAPDYSKVIESEIAGNYKGSLTVTVEGTTMPSEPQKIKIEKASPSAINLSLADFSFMGIAIGDVELKNCALSQNGDTYTFTGTQELKVDALSCTINAKGAVTNGAVKVDMDIDATVGGLKQSVKVIYEGTRLTGSESSEAKIKTFSFDSEFVIEKAIIDDEKGTITFKVSNKATNEDLVALIPTIIFSDKATIVPESGVAQDFSAGNKVTYTVTAEDGTIKKYVASVDGNILKYSFEDWSEALGGNHIYYDPLPANELATPNKGVSLLYAVSGYTGEYPVLQEEQGVKGKAIKLVTRYTKKQSGINSPTITAGSLFTGTMEISFSSMSKPLESTHFGILYSKKPVTFKGYYKYTPGDTFREGAKDGSKDEVIIDKIDECSIAAILYEIENDEDYLDGTNINNSPKRVAVAQVEEGIATDDFTPFSVSFNYLQDYDSSKKYKLAIICTASKEGDAFKGAEGSTLVLDELEIIGE